MPTIAPLLASLRASSARRHLVGPIEAALEAALFHPSSAPAYVAIFTTPAAPATPAAAEGEEAAQAAETDEAAVEGDNAAEDGGAGKRQKVAEGKHSQQQRTCQQRLLDQVCRGLREGAPKRAFPAAEILVSRLPFLCCLRSALIQSDSFTPTLPRTSSRPGLP